MTIYDFANSPVEIELPDKPIVGIFVQVISGDETGVVQFADGTCIDFDASASRLLDLNDGSYIVSGEKISKWLAFTPSDARTASYIRQKQFS